jgi:type IV pilus assembly protein PilY1
MVRNKLWFAALFTACVVQLLPARAQTYTTSTVSNLKEDFTGATTENPWFYFNGACLTASTASAAAAPGPGSPPGCIAIQTSSSGGTGGSNAYYNEPLVGGFNGVPGSTETLPDPVGEGALRFTNGCTDSGCGSGGYNQNGAIVSGDTFTTNEGLDITFKTVTYRGNSGGADGDGADGMSFFLVNAAQWSPIQNSIGAFGGSLGYDCSNTNPPYNGIVGAYLGLGIDEFGNFLNGTVNTLGENSLYTSGDNTATGGGYQPNRIGMRGAGNIAWPWLTANYPTDYPDTLSASEQEYAVQQTCETGDIWNFSHPDNPKNTGTPVMDYSAIPNAYAVLPTSGKNAVLIGDEYANGGYSRQDATPITYRVKITDNGLLSMWYSYDGGSWIGVLQNQNITDSNGPLPALLRFGFAGSTGGDTNIHELLCFRAEPVTQAASSSALNQQESSRVQNGSQVYLSYYDPSNWTGRLTANELSTDSSGNLVISQYANWDASCVLTGVLSGSSCPTTGQAGPIDAESPSSRVMLTWSGSAGIPFEWSDLTAPEQNALDVEQTASGTTNNTTFGQDLLEYLRGDRSNEITSTGSGLFRDRVSVLGDIVDSSPVWVGPPSKMSFSAYQTPLTWKDDLYPNTVMPENSGETYSQYEANEATRLNVVYVGANDGFLHGFAAGSYNSTGTTYDSSTNTGEEVLAYMPQGVLDDIHNATNPNLDYSNPQYGHNFYVDATPGVGDLYYAGRWHTWLVSGLGPGGAEIFALNVTHPSQFSESNASNLVIGDWMASNLTCANVSNCGTDLGDTYGTPVIRRLHDGNWGIIFGNGLGSASGDAGIYIMDVNSTTGAITTYYLSTGQAGTGDGIAFVTPVDMTGDHIVDYVYAGDVNGHVWRFDLTSQSPSNWAVTPGPIFSTPKGQPITTAVQPAFVTNAVTSETQLMLFFGTGEKFPLTNSSATSYASGTQAFYGVWDWNMDGWNAYGLTQFASLSPATVAGLISSSGSNPTLTAGNLVQQTVSLGANGDRTMGTAAPICWAGTLACSGGNDQFGWYIDFPGSSTGYNETTDEQLIYNPTIVSTAVVFNSTLPAINSPLDCNPGTDTGYTYAIDAQTGGPIPNFFNDSSTTLNNGNVFTVAFASEATGTDSVVTTNGTGSSGSASVGKTYLVYQTINGTAGSQQIIEANDINGMPETWIELR